MTKTDLKPTYIPSRTFALALLDIVAPSQKDRPATFDSVRTSIGNLPDSKMQKSLLGLLDSAEQDLKKARENIERWFDETMDQVTAWYKQKANACLFGVAVAACAVMNADSIAIGATLWRNPTLRAAVVSQAEQTAKNPPKELKGQAGNAAESSITRAQEIDKELQQLKIPMGWTAQSLDDFLCPKKWTTETLQKLIGLIFTAIAVSLGAPFWFDMLNKLVNFRTGGNKPEKTPAVEPLTPPPQRLEITANVPLTPMPVATPAASVGGGGGGGP